MSTYQTQGLVLSSHNFREADKIFSICTNTHGKIEALACGIRKIKSKLRAHLEPFSVVNLMIAHGRRHDRFASAITEKNYKKIKTNYQLLTTNYQLLELVDQLTKPHHPDKRIFDLLVEVFSYLENNVTMKQCSNETIEQSDEQSDNYSKNLLSYFITNLLSLLGYTPELNICVRCKSQIQDKISFSPRDGSVICSRCSTNVDIPVSSESLNILKKYLTQNLVQCHDLGTVELSKLIRHFLNYHLDRPLKSNSITY